MNVNSVTRPYWNTHDYRVSGGIVEIKLEPGEEMDFERGLRYYVFNGVKETAQLGISWKGFKRKMSGENFSVMRFKNTAKTPKLVALHSPSQFENIGVINLSELGGSFKLQKGAWIGSDRSVSVNFSLSPLSTAILGDEGLVMQTVKGSGLVYFATPGKLMELDLKEGESVVVEKGSIVGFSSSVKYRVAALKGGVVGEYYG